MRIKYRWRLKMRAIFKRIVEMFRLKNIFIASSKRINFILEHTSGQKSIKNCTNGFGY